MPGPAVMQRQKGLWILQTRGPPKTHSTRHPATPRQPAWYACRTPKYKHRLSALWLACATTSGSQTRFWVALVVVRCLWTPQHCGSQVGMLASSSATAADVIAAAGCRPNTRHIQHREYTACRCSHYWFQTPSATCRHTPNHLPGGVRHAAGLRETRPAICCAP